MKKKLQPIISFLLHSSIVALTVVFFCNNKANAQTILWTEGFDNTTTWKQGTWPSTAGGWSFFVLPTGQTGWGVATGTSAGGFHSPNQYIYSQPYNNSLYMITPAQSLAANVTYTLSFWYRNYDASNSNFNVQTSVGTTPTVSGIAGGTLIGNIANSNVAGVTYTKVSYDFVPPSSGTYYFGIYAQRISGTYVDIDDVSLSTPTCAAPCNGWIIQNCTTCPKGCYIDGGTVIPTRAVQTASTPTDTGNYGYVYWTFNGTADSTYYFDLCSSTGTAGASWLRLHDARNTSPGNNYCMNVSSTPTIITQNYANGCAGTGTGLSKLIWTCPASGTYYLESALGASMGYWGATGNQTATLTYKTLPSSAVTCTDVFYDKGIDGNNGNSFSYNNNENWTFTYYPTDTLALAIHVQFANFSTSPGDILCVYNGNSINAPILGCYSGPSITGAFTSTASDGSLTFQFTSDDSLVSPGWQANVSCVPSLGISNPLSDNNISIYPNPVMESISVSGYAHAGKTTVEISDVLGKRILALTLKNGSNETIDVHHLTSGMYYIRIENENGIRNGRFVKE